MLIGTADPQASADGAPPLQTFDVEPEHVLYIPAGAPHYYKVSAAPFEFLCIVPNTEDRIELLEQR